MMQHDTIARLTGRLKSINDRMSFLKKDGKTSGDEYKSLELEKLMLKIEFNAVY